MDARERTNLNCHDKSSTHAGSGKRSKNTGSSLSLGSSDASSSKDTEDDELGCDLSCLVAVARTLPPFTPPTNASVASNVNASHQMTSKWEKSWDRIQCFGAGY